MNENFAKLAITHLFSCDVLVAGGGMSGVCAAIAAARTGARVVLCQDRSVLGGNASSEIRMHICGADFLGCRSAQKPVEARETGIIEEIRLENAARNPQRSFSMHDLILYEKCVAEPNITLLLDCAVVGVEVCEQTIKKAFAVRSCTEDCFEITAGIFIDCTGDGRLAAEAGATFSRGRESKTTYNEPNACDTPKTGEMGMSLLFEAEDMGRPVPYKAPRWARKFGKNELALRDCSKFNYGYWWIEWGGNKDTIKDMPVARQELLGIILGVWDYIKNSGKFDSGNYALQWFGFLPGKRQSRRFKGLYTLTEKDLVNPAPVYDTIAYGGWPLDSHPPEGIDAKEKDAAVQKHTNYIYPIPLRCCVSGEIKNLMFAGRNISASYVAFSSTRVMATCGVIGQAVGTAAAISVAKGLSLQQLLEKDNIRHLQDTLLNDDCFLPYVVRKSKGLMEFAVVKASSCAPEAEAVNVKNEFTRSLDGLLPDCEAEYCWCSNPQASTPQSLEFTWNDYVVFNEMRIVFDTGLHRPLTLTRDLQSGVDEKMVWGVQPETVRGYSLFYESPEGWKKLLSVKNNYQRLNKNVFESVKTKKIRLVVDDVGDFPVVKICRIDIASF
jgi:hypothetical protein